MKRSQRPIILGVTESDCHVVANRLIELLLRAEGVSVINLGVCTPVAEFTAAYAEHPDTLAILIGSLNGHGYEDLQSLPACRQRFEITCPIVLGGNLSVGSHKMIGDETRYYALGVTHILRDIHQILPFLATLADLEGAVVKSITASDEPPRANIRSYVTMLPDLSHMALPVPANPELLTNGVHTVDCAEFVIPRANIGRSARAWTWADVYPRETSPKEAVE